MNPLLQKYLDGDLDEAAARAFEDELEHDPALAQELRTCEAALAALCAPSPYRVSPDFADRVMLAVQQADATAVRRSARTNRWRPVALAAALALCFVAGYLVAGRASRGVVLVPAGDRVASLDASGAVTPSAGMAVGDLRLVHLVYAPGQDVQQVALAGDFNGWRADTTPMRQVNGTWVLDLALPPGVYEYMFVVDGGRWITDPLARTTRDDGFGGTNAVLDLTI